MSAALVLAALAAGCVLVQRVLRRRLSATLTALALSVMLLGTFALDLWVRLPLVPAAASFALAALALFLRERPGALTTGRALMIGGAAGLAAVGHAPNAALALLALPRRGESARPVTVALAATATVWALARGLGLSAPLPAGPWEPLLVLFGSRQGLLHLTPALWLGVLGLAGQLRREAREAAPAAASIVVLIALHAACAAGPGGVCPREQLAAVLPLLALPTGLALRALRECTRRVPAAPLFSAAGLLACWNLLFMQQYATDMIPRDFPLPFAQVAQNQAALVARAVGAPLSWPANWLFAARFDTGPERFDAAAGKRVTAAVDGSLTIDVGRLDTDEALLLEGWSVRHPCGEEVCRAVESRARVLVPVPTDGPTSFRVRARGQGWLMMSPEIHGDDRVAAALGPEPADLCFVPERSPRGLRAFTLEAQAAPGQAPHALIDRITISPTPCS